MCEQEVLRPMRAGRLLIAALPLALGACGVMPDRAAAPDDAAATAMPAPASDLARAAASDIATLGWLQAAAPEPAAPDKALPAAAYLSSAPERLPGKMRQLAALDDTALDGQRGGFSLANGVTVNFGASIRSVAQRVIGGTATPFFELETSISFDPGTAGATVQTALNGAPPTVTTGVDPAVGIQVSAGDAGSTLVVHNVSTSQFNTLLQNVADNTDVTSVATLDFFLGGTIGALTSEAAATQSSLNTLLSNSLVNSLP